MSIIKRLTNLAKGAVSLAGKEGDELDRLAREQALQRDLDNPRPTETARRELHRRKTGTEPSTVSSTAPRSPEQDELSRLQKALDDGILTRAEYEQKKAEAIARLDSPGAVEPEIKRTL